MVALEVGAGSAAGAFGVPPVDGFGQPSAVSAGEGIFGREVIVLERVTGNPNAGCEFSQGEVSDRWHIGQSNPLTTPMSMGIVIGMETISQARPSNRFQNRYGL
ncbi:Uncharacterised protein [Mycobacteroides abscessus subsp. massiliense]|nr:Uncharacterised protein [Mycobacteroides abscessus subsp. massiliense]